PWPRRSPPIRSTRTTSPSPPTTACATASAPSRGTTSAAPRSAGLRRRLRAVPLVDEPISAAEEPAREHPPHRRPRDRIEEEADRDAEQQQQSVPGSPRRLGRAMLHALDAPGSVPDLVDRVPQLVLDLLVLSQAGRRVGHLAAGGELVVDRTGRDVRAADVVT